MGSQTITVMVRAMTACANSGRLKSLIIAQGVDRRATLTRPRACGKFFYNRGGNDEPVQGTESSLGRRVSVYAPPCRPDSTGPAPPLAIRVEDGWPRGLCRDRRAIWPERRFHNW